MGIMITTFYNKNSILAKEDHLQIHPFQSWKLGTLGNGLHMYRRQKNLHMWHQIFTQGKWMGKGVTYSQRQPNCTYQLNERGEPAATYKWIGWVWEITGGKAEVFKKIADHFRGIYRIYLELIKKNQTHNM
jgi:hypothetical protein